MQKIILYLTAFLASLLMQAQNSLEVSISNFDNNEGKVMVGLYNVPGHFLEKEYLSLSSEISKKQATVTFTDIPDGIYAVSCYHDEDDNNEFGMYLGMFPAEDYGNSNNVPNYFGPPAWEGAKFEIKGGEIKKIAIQLR